MNGELGEPGAIVACITSLATGVLCRAAGADFINAIDVRPTSALIAGAVCQHGVPHLCITINADFADFTVHECRAGLQPDIYSNYTEVD